MDTAGKMLKSYADVVTFVLAGNATVTLKSNKTKTRYTYNISKNEDGGKIKYWIKAMVGSDNNFDFSPIGYLIDAGDHFSYRDNTKFNQFVAKDAKVRSAVGWFFHMLSKEIIPESLEIWHEGKCGRCGRKLTVPESIETGMGPTCAKKRVPLQSRLID